ncbi:MAG: hypothetical protein FWE24_03205 [Defluviitaleaceae bacterium]|nr:hypothetical protein [Defluviitaleaceae bacterium]
MEVPRKKLVKSGIILLCAIILFFYFHAPGMLISEINAVTPESNVIIYQLIYTRADFLGVFDNFERIEHELNTKQIELLRDFLRNTWYTRSFRQILLTRVPDELYTYNTFRIIVKNNDTINPFAANLTFEFGWVLRGEGNDWFRVHNPGWEEEILRILALGL